MKKKIFLYFMILVVIGVSVTGFFVSELTQNLYEQEVEKNLKSTATILQHQILKDISENKTIDYNSIAVEYSKVLNTLVKPSKNPENTNLRITFIDFQGKVLGESENNYLTMENHLSRKEIKEAISGSIGKDIRRSKTLNIDFLYIAVPIKEANVVARVSLPLIQLKDINKTIWYYTVIGITAGLILTMLLAFKFSDTVTRPVKQLISVFKEISNGNYSKKAEVNSKDELGQLAMSFNEMGDKLEKTVADLTDKNNKVDSIMNSIISGIIAVDTNFRIILINAKALEMFGLKNDSGILGTNLIEVIRNNHINELVQETVESNIPQTGEITLGQTDSRVVRVYTNSIKSNSPGNLNSGGIISLHDITNIKKLEQIRTEFVSNVTHELKTPLTSIRGFIETLRGGAINDPDVADKFLEIIDIEAERLSMLINDILQLSEIETKQKDTNIGTYDLKPIAEEVISILQGSADKKGITLTAEIDSGVRITANRDRIKQMFINLIDNGIKYNNENGRVDVHARKEDGKVVISVKDTGIGIASEHHPRLFERFYRVDKGRSRNMGGTGLGLSIVKHIVNLYNGDIRVNSEVNKGTEFIIRLPM